MRRNFLKDKLASGKSAIGTWCVIPSAVTADIIASSGLDFVIIDAEHGPIGYETAQQMMIACESRGVSPMMRVGSTDESRILRALDIGAHGVQIPNIHSGTQVREIIHYAKFPPVGDRGFSPFVRAAGYTKDNSAEHIETANNNTLIAINLEGKDGVENIEEILAPKELDIVFIGLFDLSKSLGVPGETEHPTVTACLEQLVEKVRRAGKFAGTITTNQKTMKRALDMGVQYVVHLVDCEMLRSVYRDGVEIFRKSEGK